MKAYSREFLEQLYQTLYTIRVFETECIKLYRQGLIVGYFHPYLGEEAIRRGGVASDIASIVQEEAFDYLDAPIKILAGKNTPIPFNVNLEKACVPKQEDIVRAVKKILNT